MDSTGKTSAIHTHPPFVCMTLGSIAVVLAIGAVLLTFLERERSSFGPEATLDLKPGNHNDHTVLSPPAALSPVLRVAIAPVVSPEASLGQYGNLITYLASNVGLKPVLLRGKNYSQVNDLIRMRQCDMAMVCTYSYVLAEVAFGTRLLVAPEVEGQRVYHSLILVRAGSSATGLTDLRNQRFASCDVLSTSGWLYPVTVLKQQGIDAARFFSKHIISGSHDRSVFAVQSGLVDAAAVDSLVYEHMAAADPTLKAELKVIHRSPPFGMPPFVVPADLPDDQFAALQRVLLDMHTNAEGSRILDSLGFDRFFVPDDEDYAAVRKLHAVWLSHR